VFGVFKEFHIMPNFTNIIKLWTSEAARHMGIQNNTIRATVTGYTRILSTYHLQKEWWPFFLIQNSGFWSFASREKRIKGRVPIRHLVSALILRSWPCTGREHSVPIQKVPKAQEGACFADRARAAGVDYPECKTRVSQQLPGTRVVCSPNPLFCGASLTP